MPLRIGASAIPENMAQVTLFQRKDAKAQSRKVWGFLLELISKPRRSLRPPRFLRSLEIGS